MPRCHQDAKELLAASARVAKAAESWTFLPPDRHIPNIVLRFLTSLDTAILRIIASEILDTEIDSISVKDAVTAFYPALGPNHALASESSLGFELTEPQAGKGLAYFLSVVEEPAEKRRRCRAALRALLAVQTDDTDFLQSLEQARDLQVEAEALCNRGGKKRIDLEFRWTGVDGQRRIVVVEMKFNHLVTDGQLSKYRSHALYFSGRNMENVRLVLLTVTGKRHRSSREKDHQDWIPVSWSNFLRRWEHEIATGHTDTNTFRCFRHQLWNKIKG